MPHSLGYIVCPSWSQFLRQNLSKLFDNSYGLVGMLKFANRYLITITCEFCLIFRVVIPVEKVLALLWSTFVFDNMLEVFRGHF